jgi:sugar phosphate permease
MTMLDIDDSLYRKVAFRLLPILGLGYLIAYMDRVNVGFAKLEMSADIGLSSAAYGLGAGIFFLAYCLLEVPSNLVLEKVGARVWICRIMVTWGIVTILTGFVQNTGQFYVARIALGAAEAGFFPGVMYLLGQWFPRPRLARATAVIVMCGSLAGVVVGPVSGWVMEQFDAVAGLAGWQWLFVVQGVPAVLLGLVVLATIPDRPAKARWLDDTERAALLGAVAPEAPTTHTGGMVAKARVALGDRGVWALGFCMAATYLAVYAVAFWLPTIIEATGMSDLSSIGLVSAIPGIVAAVAVLVLGGIADRTGSHARIATLALLGAAVGLVVSVAMGTALAPTIIGLAIANGLAFAAVPAIWWLVHRHLGHGAGAAAGVALVNTIASFGSFLGPYVIGVGQDWTGSLRAPVILIAVVCVVAAAVVTTGFSARRRILARQAHPAVE